MKVIECPQCNEKAAPGSRLTKCEKCKKMVWIDPARLKIKTEEGHPVWCRACTQKEPVETVAIPEPDRKKDLGLSDTSSDDAITEKLFACIEKVGTPEFAEEFEKIEESLYFRSKEAVEFALDRAEQHLPHLIHACMARLRVFDRVDDLAIATLLATLIEFLLLRRREKKKPLFEDYPKDALLGIFAMLIGVQEASKKATKENLSFPSDEEWREGMMHWSDGLRPLLGEDGDNFFNRVKPE